MDVAPAAVEVAVVMGAVVQGGCVQQYAAAAAWVWQRAACVGGAAGGGGRGHNCNGWQAARVRAAVAADVACVQQCAAERGVCGNVQWQQCVCGSG
jgi:hypothetical protein